MSKKKILVFALTVALLIIVQTVHAHTLAPDFSFTDTEGQTRTLSSFRGKVVLLEFFSVSCGACAREVDQLKTVYNTFPTNLVMISIGMDTDDTLSAVKAYKTSKAIPWIMAGNPSAPRAHSPIYTLYDGRFCGSGIPQIYIIDQAGYIRYCHIGTTSSSTLVTEIKTLITPTITVISPNGGQSWVRGTTHAIKWTSTGSPGAYVKIELLKSGIVNKIIASSTANDGSYSWTISSTQTLGTDYKIRITSTSKPSITDSSNSNFAIVRGTLTVTSPNGGESWKRGTVHTITWSKSGSTGSYVKIELLKSGVVNRVITSSTANDGSYSWTILSTQTLGTDYKIRITSTSYSSISDSSNSNFYVTT